MNHKDITVILLLFNTPDKLLKNFEVYKTFKVIILDQSNDKIFKKKLIKLLPNIQSYELANNNLGFAKGINKLVKKVKTKYFFCTQPDVNIDKKSIYNLKRTILKHKTNAITVIPKINEASNYSKNKKEIIVKKMIGAIFLASKKKFLEIGMFDEDFFFYWEDVDLSNRINNSKYNIYLNKKSKAIHLGGLSSKMNSKNLFVRSLNFKFGEYLYLFKNKKLRVIKIIREPFLNLIYSFINIFLFDTKKIIIKLGNFVGILKFYFFILRKSFK
tara:strand:- start:441 stop:1256 length:816 start_codon:yes stop_codon:yes gene_type:complete